MKSSIYDSHLLETINKAYSGRPNARKLRRKERALERAVQTELDREKAFVLEEYAKLLDGGKAFRRGGNILSKSTSSDLDAIFDDLNPDLLIQIVLEHAQTAMQFGADYRIKESNLAEIGISFDLLNPLAVQYLQTDRPLVLANMTDTTKNEIKPILQAALDSGQSYNETAREIADAFAFSRDRSLMIAVNEIGHAYEWGNYVPMKDAQDKGHKSEKSWLTVGDDRVTEECNANQRMGWLMLDRPFASGDLTAPRTSNPRCRCTTLYRIS